MIQVDVKTFVRGKVNAAMLARAARAALKGRIESAQISILLVGDARMRGLNRNALGHDYTTDVLSFDHGESPEGRLIELVVCPPFASRQAKEHGIPQTHELARYVVHGCLHCAGFDDATDREKQRMWTVQESILKELLSTG